MQSTSLVQSSIKIPMVALNSPKAPQISRCKRRPYSLWKRKNTRMTGQMGLRHKNMKRVKLILMEVLMKLMLKQSLWRLLQPSLSPSFSLIFPGREQLKLDLDQRLLMSCHARSVGEHIDRRLSLAGPYLLHACWHHCGKASRRAKKLDKYLP